jgi:ApbE superfamily uncharacterized protein (UPF0280 family)
MLADGRRLHLQHGPIDLVIEAFGPHDEVRRAYEAARARFETVLPELAGELPVLRRAGGPEPEGVIAAAMWRAVQPYAPEFVTPMAAVAGGVADEILRHMEQAVALDRAYVNNGGDIALMVNDGHFRIGICDNPAIGLVGGQIDIRAGDGIGGVATSGWRGRSFSLGIADAVTVLAPTAAEADAAATMVANRIDLPGSPKVTRAPADTLQPDSDLGARLVTVDVAELSRDEAAEALAPGQAAAAGYLQRGLFRAACLALGSTRMTVPDVFRPQIWKE